MVKTVPGGRPFASVMPLTSAVSMSCVPLMIGKPTGGWLPSATSTPSAKRGLFDVAQRVDAVRNEVAACQRIDAPHVTVSWVTVDAAVEIVDDRVVGADVVEECKVDVSAGSAPSVTTSRTMCIWVGTMVRSISSSNSDRPAQAASLDSGQLVGREDVPHAVDRGDLVLRRVSGAG